MQMEVSLQLEKKAKRSGGDKYVAENFNVYIPQTISRKNGDSAQIIILTIHDNPTDETMKFILERKAMKKGGDKYHSFENEEFNIYFPQSISRSNSEPYDELHITLT